MRISDVLNIAVKGKTATINIDGIIGYPASWQHENSSDVATNSEDLRNELLALEDIEKNVTKIIVNISSPGGSVYHANEMLLKLKEHKANVYINFVGNSASAATMFLGATKRENISIYENLSLLIHEVRGVYYGDTASLLERAAEEQKIYNRNIAKIYSSVNNLSVDDNLELMAIDNGEGKLLDADEALKLGFVGNVKQLNKKVAAFDVNRFEGLNYNKDHINKLLNINKKFENMGLSDLLKKKKPTYSVNIGDAENSRILTYKSLEKGEKVAILNETEAYSGNFHVDGKTYEVENDKIVNISDVSSNENALENLTSLVTNLTEKVTNLTEKIDNLEKETADEIFNLSEKLNQKITISTPKVPQNNFNADTRPVENIEKTEAQERRELQKKLDEADAKAQSERNNKIKGGY
jgi:ATP-dependent protease ClpP protease subunit